MQNENIEAAFTGTVGYGGAWIEIDCPSEATFCVDVSQRIKLEASHSVQDVVCCECLIPNWAARTAQLCNKHPIASRSGDYVRFAGWIYIYASIESVTDDEIACSILRKTGIADSTARRSDDERCDPDEVATSIYLEYFLSCDAIE